MKRILVVLTVLAFFLTFATQLSAREVEFLPIQSSNHSILIGNEAGNASGPTLETVAGYFPSSIEEILTMNGSRIEVDGCINSIVSGSPVVPMKNLRLAFAGHYQITGINLVSGNVQQAVTQGRIYPGPERRRWSPDESRDAEIFVENPQVYRRDSFYPSKWMDYSAGYDGDSTIVFIHVYPVQWNPVTQELLYLNDYQVQVYGEQVTNESERYRVFGDLDDILTEAEHILLYADGWATSAESFAVTLTSWGISTDIVSVDSIYALYEPAEDPLYPGYSTEEYPFITPYDFNNVKRIIAFFRDETAHDNLEYFTILGDAGIIPPSYYFNGIWEVSPTDHFYESPDYDWVVNYSGARLALDTPEEMDTYVTKLTNWHGAQTGDWLGTASLGGGQPFESEFYIGELINNQVLVEGVLNNFSPIKLQHNRGNFNSSNYWMHMNNDNMFWQLLICHGSGDAIYFDNHSMIDVDQLMILNAKGQLPIFLSVACSNGSYDSDINSEAVYPLSFAEGLIRSPGAGIAYIGGARSNSGVPLYEVVDGNLAYTGITDTYALLYYFMDSYRSFEEPTMGRLYKASKDRFLLEQTMTNEMNIAAYLRQICHGVSGVGLPPAPESVEMETMPLITSESYINQSIDHYAVVLCENGEDPVYDISDDDYYQLMTMVPALDDVTTIDYVNGTFSLTDVTDASMLLNRIVREDGCERWHYSVVFNSSCHLDGLLNDWDDNHIIGADDAGEINPSCFDLQQVYALHEQESDRVYMAIELADDYLEQLEDYGFLWLMIAIDDIEGQGFNGNIDGSGYIPWMCFTGFENGEIDKLLMLNLNTYGLPGFLHPQFDRLEWHVYEDDRDDWRYTELSSQQLLASAGEECIELYIDTGLLDLENARMAVFTTEYNGIFDDVIPTNVNGPTAPMVGQDNGYAISEYIHLGQLLAIVDSEIELPVTSYLGCNYPNPFNPVTIIPFSLETTQQTTLRIYNLQGQLIRTLIDAELQQGHHSIIWNGDSNSGTPVASGVYFLRMQAGSFQQNQRMILLK